MTAPLENTATYKDMYVSPYYHHVVVSGLQPGATYYYRPFVQPRDDDTKATFTGAHITSVNDQDANKNTHNQEDDDDEEFVDPDDDIADHESSRGRVLISRALVSWPPYNGSERECPSPDKIHSFTTAPSTHPDAPVTLAVIGDLGQFPHSEETLARMERDRNEINVVILAGDIAYTNEDHRRWDTFFDFLDDYPLFDKIPLQVCPGNHDIDKLPHGDDIFLGYENRFRMPRVHPPQLGKFKGPDGPMNMDAAPYPLPYEWGNSYYSFTYGSAFIIMLNAYASLDPGSTQHQWIVEQLAKVDRTRTPWLIVVLHPPIYNTFSLHPNDLQIKAAQDHLEPLIVKYRANLVFTGHIHAYSRTATVSHGTVTPTGTIHITVGAGGRKCEGPFKSPEPEPWIHVRDATIYGYGMLRILNHTTAVWDWIHTGHTDKDRWYNEVGHSSQTLPPGPVKDTVLIANQYYL